MLKKIILAVLFIEGVLAITHGMTQNNDPVFIVGIISVTIVYIIIRKDLKKIGEKRIENEPGDSMSADEKTDRD